MKKSMRVFVFQKYGKFWSISSSINLLFLKSTKEVFSPIFFAILDEFFQSQARLRHATLWKIIKYGKNFGKIKWKTWFNWELVFNPLLNSMDTQKPKGPEFRAYPTHHYFSGYWLFVNQNKFKTKKKIQLYNLMIYTKCSKIRKKWGIYFPFFWNKYYFKNVDFLPYLGTKSCNL